MVDTLDRGPQHLEWVGQRTVAAKGEMAPVVFEAGALGNVRRLVVSPQHRMLLNGWQAELLFNEPEVLVPAVFLTDGARIYSRPGGWITYVHLLFAQHEIVFAEGAPSESFHPGAYGISTMPSDQRDEVLSLFPELPDRAASYGPGARRSLKSYEARLLAG